MRHQVSVWQQGRSEGCGLRALSAKRRPYAPDVSLSVVRLVSHWPAPHVIGNSLGPRKRPVRFVPPYPTACVLSFCCALPVQPTALKMSSVTLPTTPDRCGPFIFLPVFLPWPQTGVSGRYAFHPSPKGRIAGFVTPHPSQNGNFCGIPFGQCAPSLFRQSGWRFPVQLNLDW
jgi:hypothetical protein